MSTLKLYYNNLRTTTKTQIPKIFINNDICVKCFHLLKNENKYVCPKCLNLLCLNCLTKRYKLTGKLEEYCCYCKEKLPNEIKNKIILDSFKFYFQCLNSNCNNCELYKYNNQIICRKCNKVYCSKCFKEIYPKQIETLIDGQIKLIENQNYELYTEEQKAENHKCKNRDVKLFNFQLKKTFFCPLCYKIHNKKSEYSVLCSNLEVSYLIKLDFSFNIKSLFELYKKDVYRNVITNSLTFFEHNYE